MEKKIELTLQMLDAMQGQSEVTNLTKEENQLYVKAVEYLHSVGVEIPSYLVL